MCECASDYAISTENLQSSPALSHAPCSLRLPAARVAPNLAPAPRGSSSVTDQRRDNAPSDYPSRTLSQGAAQEAAGSSWNAPARTTSAPAASLSQSSRDYGTAASAAPVTSAASDRLSERSSSGRTQVAPFSRQGSDGVHRGASAASSVESAVLAPPDVNEDPGDAGFPVVSSKSKTRSKKSSDGEEPARVIAAQVLPVAAAAGEEYDDWDAADAPAADVAAVSEKKKKVSRVVFCPLRK